MKRVSWLRQAGVGFLIVFLIGGIARTARVERPIGQVEQRRPIGITKRSSVSITEFIKIIDAADEMQTYSPILIVLRNGATLNISQVESVNVTRYGFTGHQIDNAFMQNRTFHID